MDQAHESPPTTTANEAEVSAPRKPDTAAANRRTAERVNVAAEVGLYSDSNFYTGFTEDVSEGGLFVATYELMPIGTVIDLEFGLPGGAEFKVKGKVRWLRDPIMSDDAFPGMGVQFIELTPENKAHIQEFVAAREPLFYCD